MASVQIKRIYSYRNKMYTYVANLSTQPVYIPYLGNHGRLFPALSATTVPILCLVRPYKGQRKRKKYAQALYNDTISTTNPNGKLAIGTLADVQAAINSKRGSNTSGS